jgi:archaeal chaperonin
MLASREVGSAAYRVFNKDRGRLKGREAWNNNLQLAALAASKLSSCLGPTGAYKLVAYHRGPEFVTKVTKDAVDIVDELGVEHPAIKTLAEAAKIHREEAGDGVSTLLVIIAALLEKAQLLIETGLHPVAILDGYKEAARKSIDEIDKLAFDFSGDLEDSLLQMIDSGRGLLNKSLRKDLAEAVHLVEDQNGIDLARIRIEKKLGGAIDDSRLVRGLVIKKEKKHRSMPEIIERPKIALVQRKLELKPLEQLAIGEGPFPTRLNVTEPGQLRQYKAEERILRDKMVEKVKDTGANVLLCGHKIDERVADKLGRAGIFALEMFNKHDFDEISRVTGAKVAGTVNLLSKEDLGSAKSLEVDKIPPERIVIIYADGVATILLRGSSPELVQELEKIVKKGILVVKHSMARPKVVAGGGAVFEELALRMKAFAVKFSARQQLAVRAFGEAMETIPKLLAINRGLDPIDTITQLRSEHAEHRSWMGVGDQGCTDVRTTSVVELASIVKTTLWRALEVASLLLKVDDYFYVKNRALFHKQ